MSLEHWLPIAVGVFLVSMMLYGHYRGFLRQCVSIGALVITILAVRFATPYVTSFLKENTQERQAVAEMMEKASGLEEYQAEQQDTPAFQRIAIENLKLPQSMKDALIENNNSEVYNLLGVDHFIEYVSAYLAGILINASVSVLMFLLTFLLIQLLVRWLDLLARLPIISGLNKIAGALLGLAHGLLLLWVACLLLDLFSATPLGSVLMEQVEESSWLTFLYQYNLLGFLLRGILNSIL